MDRRNFIQKAALGTLAASFMLNFKKVFGITLSGAPFSQAPLKYSFAALEPHIDAKTMEVHFTKHHTAYIKNANDAFTAEKITEKNIEKLLSNISKYSTKFRNNLGGHYNHNLFWEILTPNGTKPEGEFKKAIDKQFGSPEQLWSKIESAGLSVFGSGWVWLVVNNGKLEIGTTPNQDNPLMDVSAFKGTPLLAIDVWEHAYYLNYQNRRADYLKAIGNVIDFKTISVKYNSLSKGKK